MDKAKIGMHVWRGLNVLTHSCQIIYFADIYLADLLIQSAQRNFKHRKMKSLLYACSRLLCNLHVIRTPMSPYWSPVRTLCTGPGSAQLGSAQLGSAQPGSTRLDSARLDSAINCDINCWTWITILIAGTINAKAGINC